MSLLRALIGGMVGGALGAGVWVIVSQFTGYEIGYVAVLVGFLAGWFVQKACAAHYVGMAHGVIASICAVLAIVGAKYSLVNHSVTAAKQAIDSVEPGRDELIACVADCLVVEIHEKGQTVGEEGSDDSSTESTDGDSTVADDDTDGYPQAIMAVATECWDQLLDEEKESYVNKARHIRAASMGFGPAILSSSVRELTKEEFKNSFGLFDVLWFALAIGAAFKFGSTDPFEGEEEEDDDEDDDEEEDDE